jgi:endonuclease-3
MVDAMPAPAATTLLRIDAHLGAAFGPSPRWLYPDPVDILVLALLSARTEDDVALAAIRVLRVRFPHWEALVDADPAIIERLIGRTTWPDRKTLYLQEALRALRTAQGRLDLDFLSGRPVAEASAWLQELPGVGPKTAASVLLFSRLRMRVLPVCTGHHRVAKRLGLISRRASAEAAHGPLLAILPEAWDVGRIERHHWMIKRLGKDICVKRRPLCWRCPVQDLCPTYGRIRAVPAQPACQLELPLHPAARRPAGMPGPQPHRAPVRLPGPSGRMGPGFALAAGTAQGDRPAG